MEQVFPFPKSIFKGSFKKADPKDVEDYVNRVMESVFGSNHAAQFPFRDPLPKKEKSMDAAPEIDIFETADHVFVKIPAAKEQIDNIKIKHTSQALFLENFHQKDQQKRWSSQAW